MRRLTKFNISLKIETRMFGRANMKTITYYIIRGCGGGCGRDMKGGGGGEGECDKGECTVGKER